MRFRSCWFFAVVVMLWQCTPVVAQPLQLVNAFPSLTFTQPVYMTHSNDGTNRNFVVQKNGLIRVFPNDSTATSAPTFLNLSSRIVTGGGGDERGLLGLAFHPNYASNGYFYVHYTQVTTGRTIIARYNVTSGNPNTADFNSELILLNIYDPYTNHNGGILFFGLDGYLYAGLGDGGSAGDPGNRAQNLDSLLGKVLRLNVDTTVGAQNYGIPPTNPFVGGGGRPEIFAWGMRNPWRMSQDPVTGLIWCGDVGQGSWEEVDIIENGKNYGWKTMEGFHCYSPSSGCNMTGLTLPIKEYDHAGGRCSLTGGFVYRGSRRPELTGRYIYGDYCSRQIWKLMYQGGIVTEDAQLLTAASSILSFGIDQLNELYVLCNDGIIYRFNSAVPAITVSAPNGGENWSIGTTQNIQWTSSNVSGDVKIELSTNGGSTFPTILFASTPNDNAESWIVTGPASSSARVRISSVVTPSIADTSNTNFTITQPSITVTTPNGGETWGTGLPQSILWTSMGVSGNVKVELSRDGGSTFTETLFASTANDGTEPWTVTGPVTSSARVRISSVTNPSVMDSSNSVFSISSGFSLLTRMYLRDNGGSLDSLEYGTGAGATDGIDASFGEFELPPLPPTGVMDVRWQIAGTLGTERDIRDTLGGTHQQIIYTGKLQAGEGYPFVLKWNNLDLPAGTFTLRDGPAGAFFLVNMKLQDSLVFTDDQIPQFQIVYDAGNVVSSAAQTGWNILSVPVTVADRRKTVVFPGSTSNAFAYTPIGYVNDDTLDYGVGYWLKFPSTQSLSLTGGAITSDTVEVIQGWNIIGSISTSVPVGSIIQIPGGIVASSYFGYGITGYGSATSIDPMRGYWVKVNQSGKLVLPQGTISRKPNKRIAN